VLSKEQIHDAVWGDAQTVESGLVEVYAGKVRRKLQAASASVLIETCRGNRLPPDQRRRCRAAMSSAIKRRDAFSPRQPAPLFGRVILFLGCTAMLAVVLVIEIAVPNNPTLGGMLLLAVLFATWLLPTPMRR